MRVLSTAVKLSSFALLFCFTGSSLFAQAPAATGDAESLAAAEIAFASESLDKGTRTAFLNALSDESMVFGPGPQNGKKYWEAKPKSESVLQWQPVFVFAATSGDLGYSTRPWNYKEKASAEKPVAHGQFVSVWRWENGHWKVLLDLGSDNPTPTEPAPELQLLDNHAPNEPTLGAKTVMLTHDRNYAADRAKNFSAMASDQVRLYLPGKFPVLGQEAAGAALREESSKIQFGEAKGEVSRGGDLGYAWGDYREGEGKEATGDYLRIWRKGRAGKWELALDLIHLR